MVKSQDERGARIDERMKEFIQRPEVKQLVYNIIAMQHEKPFHSLAVLSFYPHEGKTLLSAALALVYSEVCRSPVLILDTTTTSHPDSLDLRDCVRGSASVSVQSLRELRSGSTTPVRGRTVNPTENDEDVLVPEVDPHLSRPSFNMALHKDNDFMLIKKAAEDQSGQYGLIIVDTAPLHEKNRSNMDPLLVARLSDASVIVVSKILLEAQDLAFSLKMLEDPALHLIGMVANEELPS